MSDGYIIPIRRPSPCSRKAGAPGDPSVVRRMQGVPQAHPRTWASLTTHIVRAVVLVPFGRELQPLINSEPFLRMRIGSPPLTSVNGGGFSYDLVTATWQAVADMPLVTTTFTSLVPAPDTTVRPPRRATCVTRRSPDTTRRACCRESRSAGSPCGRSTPRPTRSRAR